jgi:hypothetical protein
VLKQRTKLQANKKFERLQPESIDLSPSQVDQVDWLWRKHHNLIKIDLESRGLVWRSASAILRKFEIIVFLLIFLISIATDE